MKKEQAMRFKELFEQEKEKLVYSHGILNEEFHVQKEELMDETDQTSVDLEQSMRIRLRNREALFLKKIDQALRRIEEGSFGVCEACDEDIEIKRLVARPTTTLCLNCKEEQERRERVHVGSMQRKSVGSLIGIR